MVFKFAGVDSMDAAELLIGCELQIPLSERAQLDSGATYVSDLVGCTVVDLNGGDLKPGSPAEVGTIKDVEFGTGEAPTLVLMAASGTEEIMVPFAAEYLTKLDLAAKRLEMRLPEGLIELQRPAPAQKKETSRRRH
jgi:16S rRNA processing protein RimM